MKIIANQDHKTLGSGQKSIEIANDVDPRTLDLTGIDRIDLHFPKFTDGRAYSQAHRVARPRLRHV